MDHFGDYALEILFCKMATIKMLPLKFLVPFVTETRGKTPTFLVPDPNPTFATRQHHYLPHQ